MKPLHLDLYLNPQIVHLCPCVGGYAWTPQIVGSEVPTQYAIIKEIVAGNKRMLAHRAKKEPDILKKHVEHFATEETNLSDIHTIEMSRLKESDMQINKHAELFIESSRTDQYQDGVRVVIARTGEPTYPISMLEHYNNVYEWDCWFS